MAKENTESSKDGGKPLMVVLNQAMRIPGMKVDRERFLREQFASAPRQVIEDIVKRGPVAAGCDRKILYKMARQIVLKRTGQSTSASFLAGVPGGITMAVTIPGDAAQFYGFAFIPRCHAWRRWCQFGGAFDLHATGEISLEASATEGLDKRSDLSDRQIGSQDHVRKND